MSDTNPIFRFEMRVVGKDRLGYYRVRWDDAKPITIIAQTFAQAEEKAKELLGEHRDGLKWLMVADKIDEIFTPNLDAAINSTKEDV